MHRAGRTGVFCEPEREPMLVRSADVSTNDKEMIMAITPNKDQVKGELKDLGGKIQEEAGKLVGSKEQQTTLTRSRRDFTQSRRISPRLLREIRRRFFYDFQIKLGIG
jgi:hypothetical protein